MSESPNIGPDWYVPKAEREKDNPRRFRIRPLSGIERFDVRLNEDESGRAYFSSKVARAVLRYGLVDWENVPAPFVQGDLDANLEKLDFVTLHELVNEIFERTFLNGEARKN